MNGRFLCLFILILFASFPTRSQKVSSYRWNNRVLMVLSENPGSVEVKRQMTLFTDQSEELNERKLIILQVFPTYYLMGYDNFIRRDDNQLYFDYKTTETPFEVVLIGLDGGLKFQRRDVVLPTELYAIIDAMPMRRSERK
jgi:hypothetical protein